MGKEIVGWQRFFGVRLEDSDGIKDGYKEVLSASGIFLVFLDAVSRSSISQF